MINLGNTAYATTESSQHCFLGAQTGKHLLWKQNVSEKKQEHFCFSEKKCFRNKRDANRETFRAHVSSTMFLAGAFKEHLAHSLNATVSNDFQLSALTWFEPS